MAFCKFLPYSSLVILAIAVVVSGQQDVTISSAPVRTPPRLQTTPNTLGGKPLVAGNPQFGTTTPKFLVPGNNVNFRQEPGIIGARQAAPGESTTTFRPPLVPKRSTTRPTIDTPKVGFAPRFAATTQIMPRLVKFGAETTTKVNQLTPVKPRQADVQLPPGKQFFWKQPTQASVTTGSPFQQQQQQQQQQPGNPVRPKRDTHRAKEINLRMREMEVEDGEGSPKERRKERAQDLLLRLLETIQGESEEEATTVQATTAAPRMCPRFPGTICRCHERSSRPGFQPRGSQQVACPQRPSQPCCCRPRSSSQHVGCPPRSSQPGCCRPSQSSQMCLACRLRALGAAGSSSQPRLCPCCQRPIPTPTAVATTQPTTSSTKAGATQERLADEAENMVASEEQATTGQPRISRITINLQPNKGVSSEEATTTERQQTRVTSQRSTTIANEDGSGEVRIVTSEPATPVNLQPTTIQQQSTTPVSAEQTEQPLTEEA